jgi:hypothetical protein
VSTDGTSSAPLELTTDAATRRLVAVGFMVTGALLLLRSAGIWFGDALVWPVLLAASGSGCPVALSRRC